MLIQFPACELQFKDIVMRIRRILWSPIPADQIMPGNEISSYSEGVHKLSIIKELRRA